MNERTDAGAVLALLVALVCMVCLIAAHSAQQAAERPVLTYTEGSNQ